MVMPIILFAAGSAYGIHVISHYKDEITGKTFTAAEHREFVFAMTRRLVKPVFLSALTTFAGFISFCFATLSSMRDVEGPGLRPAQAPAKPAGFDQAGFAGPLTH